MEAKRECVSVTVRIRPVLCQDSTTSSCLHIVSKEPPVLAVPDRAQTFYFDQIFSEDAGQKQVFRKTIRPLLDHVKSGFKCTVFAYGQTGSGKTYTMGTDPKLICDDDLGIIPRSLDYLFENIRDSTTDINAYVSFAEIYNEKVFDLLSDTNRKALNMSGFVVQGLSEKRVKNSVMAKQFLQLGNKNRHTGETKQNMNSSRSHAIFTIEYRDGEVSGKLNLVDLAGSESVKKTGSHGSTFQEGVNINKGLLSIGQVISALSTKSSFIPYRLSLITSILQGSLNTENFVSLIACVSPSPDDVAETLQTLDFAQRVKKIKINPEVNLIISKHKSGYRTPIKRPVSSTLQTPFSKKVSTHLSMPLINESQERAQSNLVSVDHCSITRELAQQALSPVIRKYMTKIETSLMDHLETVVTKTLQRQNLRPEDKKSNCDTPSMPWDKIQHEVTKLVRTEFAQMSNKAVRATSNTLKDKICRILSYDGPENSEPKIEETFKMPDIPKRHKPTTVSPISLIETHQKVTPCRSSDVFNDNSNSFKDSISEGSVKELAESDSVNISTRYDRVGRRRSVRIANRDVNCRRCNPSLRVGVNGQRNSTVSFVVARTPAKSLSDKNKKEKSEDSPFTAHLKQVLCILNMGNLRQIEKLHCIGEKTAEQILLYRQLRGSFGKIEDLRQMPTWGSKKFEKFLETNFLTRH